MDSGVSVSLDCTGPATVALRRHRDGRVEQLLFDGTAELPSGVYRNEGGRILTGREALNASATAPDRYIAAPLRLLESAPEHSTVATDLGQNVAAVLSRVREQADRTAGTAVNSAVIVVPPGWGPQRRTRLRDAAHHAGLTDVEFIDATTALGRRHLGPANAEAVVLVCRIVGTSIDATILRTGGANGYEPVATLADADFGALDGAAITARAVSLVQQAVAAADLAGTDVTLSLLDAPPPYVPALGAGLRDLGIAAPVRTVGVTDTVYGALDLAHAAQAETSSRRRSGGHAIGAALPIPAAIALLYLLLQTGVYHTTDTGLLAYYPPPHYMYALWPAWSMVAVLVFINVLAIVLLNADRRLHGSPNEPEADRRRQLARGLLITAAAGVAAGIVTAMLGTATYERVPLWFLLLWTTGPALVLACIAALIAVLVQQGQTSAARWQLWLRLPNTTTALAAVGLFIMHVYLLTNVSAVSNRYSPGLPDGIERLGTIAVALAILPLALRRIDHQILASPFVIAAVIWTHSFTNMGVVIGVLLIAITLWWLTRIRPAAAREDGTGITRASEPSTGGHR